MLLKRYPGPVGHHARSLIPVVVIPLPSGALAKCKCWTEAVSTQKAATNGSRVDGGVHLCLQLNNRSASAVYRSSSSTATHEYGDQTMLKRSALLLVVENYRLGLD